MIDSIILQAARDARELSALCQVVAYAGICIFMTFLIIAAAEYFDGNRKKEKAEKL